jgi:hypothetical protein
MPGFEYRQAEEIRDAFRAHQVRFLFIGKSGAILLGFPDTPQDAALFVERSRVMGKPWLRHCNNWDSHSRLRRQGRLNAAKNSCS